LKELHVMKYPVEARRVFVDAVVDGVPVGAAAALVGASRRSGTSWWRQSAGMELVTGRGGGLKTAPPTGGWDGSGLTALERDQIAGGLAAGDSKAKIAKDLGRHRSTIGREIERNSGPDGTYFPSVAHAKAFQRARRPKPFKLVENVALCVLIAAFMDQGWSPKLIAWVLARDAGDDQTQRVSHETIYQALYVQTRGSLRADLAQQLSLQRTERKSSTSTRRSSSPYLEAFKISERPQEVADRAVPGHWEGDLIIGANGSAIGTLVERKSRFTILLHLPERHTADLVATAMIEAMRDLPARLRQSITWDRGTELADYARIQVALDAKLFFADPHSPWQRGTNENTNRLLRHWFEKGQDLRVHDAAKLKEVAASLNARPRPTLNYKTPAQALNEILAEAA
jgi:IS30 family transposase